MFRFGGQLIYGFLSEINLKYWLLSGALLIISVSLAVVSRFSICAPAGRCMSCGYDLRATPERCPECGRTVVSREGPPAG